MSMWCRLVSPRTVGAGAAMTGLLVLRELDRRRNNEGNLSSSTSEFQVKKVIPSCLCESSSALRKLETSTSKASLRSRYAVRWNAPLGEGGFGAVYAATDRQTGEQVALKKISKKYTDDVGLRREMAALLHLREAGGHPNICGLHEHFDEGRHFFITLDLISGGEMFDHLIQSGPYSEADAARLVREVASALAFMHGIDCVHGDLKPENLMLSTRNNSDAVVKVIDFGCAQVDDGGSIPPAIGSTPVYCPPEVLGESSDTLKRMDPSLDMWSLGIIVYIMLMGCHPFDLSGDASEEEIAKLIRSRQAPPLVNSPLTAHLSASAIDLIRRLLAWEPKDRLTALEMLEHPWVRGKTARKDKMADSDKRLSKFRVFKSRLEAKVFADIMSWSDTANSDDVSKRTSLIERSFRKFDAENKGFLTAKDLTKQFGSTTAVDDESEESLSLSAFSDLLSDHMRNKYFPKGYVLFREGEEGNEMFFVNSGVLEISTTSGFRTNIGAGEPVGEGALLSPNKTRSATVKCATPVHAIEITREYFDKYLSASETGLQLKVREKDKTRALNRTKTILRRQKDLKPLTLSKGDYLFKIGSEGHELYILEEGIVDVLVEDHTVFTAKPGDLCGETSLVTNRPRTASGVCVSNKCKVHVMKADDFHALVDSSPNLKDSVHDVCLRREFQKAVVFKTKKHFPTKTSELRAVFDAIDEDGSGTISLDEVGSILLHMDNTAPEEEINGIMHTLDIDDSGLIDFEEFAHIFGMHQSQKTAAEKPKNRKTTPKSKD